MTSAPQFTLGIEEEYLLVDKKTGELAAASEAIIEECAKALKDQVSPEFLRCQVETGTRVARDITEARDDLRRLRTTVAEIAEREGLAPIAAGCHPFAEWDDQSFTDKQRYRELERDLGGVARRMLICGMHVHVGLEEKDLRIDLMNQFTYFLPHLLVLSTSSPFWRGRDTGLASYRLTVFDNLPRTGLPPHMPSWSEYQRSVDIIIDTGQIEDSSKIWWDLRPSEQFPTLESRICDVCPRLEHALSIAALTQCLMRMLWRLRRSNQRWRVYDNFLISENRWLAQRYGAEYGLIDFGIGKIVPYPQLLEELIALVEEDAIALGCEKEVHTARNIIEEGTSSDRQRAVFNTAIENSATKGDANLAVVHHLIDEFTADL